MAEIRITNETELKAHLAEGKSVSRFSTDVTMRGANLRGADLCSADLYGADLHGADLYRADLRGANLYGADLYGANLRGANLRGADLYGANLYGADLCSADLYGADLRGAKMNWQSHNLIAERLRQVASDDVLLRLAAGYVAMSQDMCHRQLIAKAPVIAHPEHGTVMAWALRQMASWRIEGDDFPTILTQAIANLEVTKGE